MRRIQEPSYWWILSLMFLILPKHKACHPGKYSPARFGATMQTNSSIGNLSWTDIGKAEFGCVFPPLTWNPEPGFRSRVHGHTLTSMLRSGSDVQPFRRDCYRLRGRCVAYPSSGFSRLARLWSYGSRLTQTC